MNITLQLTFWDCFSLVNFFFPDFLYVHFKQSHRDGFELFYLYFIHLLLCLGQRGVF